jgi:propanol-preferring alcohol dehydrogenase
MKAWVVDTPGPMATGPLVAVERPAPDPEPGEIRVRVSACGVCRTDLHLAEGDLPPHRAATVPGHEVVGTVDALGAGSRRFRVGQRAGIAWLRSTCGHCHWCHRGAGSASTGSGRPPTWRPRSRWRRVPRCTCSPGRRRRSNTRSSSVPTPRDGPMPPRPSHWTAPSCSPPSATWCRRRWPPLDRGGTLAIAGIHLTEVPPLDYERHLFLERQVRSVTANTRADGEEFLALAARLGLRVTTTPYPLEAADRALADLASDRVTGAAVLLA